MELRQKICNELKSVGIPFKEGQTQSAAGMDPGSESQLVLIINDRFRRSAEVVLQNLMFKMTFTSDQETIYDNKIKLHWQKN